MPSSWRGCGGRGSFSRRHTCQAVVQQSSRGMSCSGGWRRAGAAGCTAIYILKKKKNLTMNRPLLNATRVNNSDALQEDAWPVQQPRVACHYSANQHSRACSQHGGAWHVGAVLHRASSYEKKLQRKTKSKSSKVWEKSNAREGGIRIRSCWHQDLFAKSSFTLTHCPRLSSSCHAMTRTRFRAGALRPGQLMPLPHALLFKIEQLAVPL